MVVAYNMWPNYSTLVVLLFKENYNVFGATGRNAGRPGNDRWATSAFSTEPSFNFSADKKSLQM